MFIIMSVRWESLHLAFAFMQPLAFHPAGTNANTVLLKGTGLRALGLSAAWPVAAQAPLPALSSHTFDPWDGKENAESKAL